MADKKGKEKKVWKALKKLCSKGRGDIKPKEAENPKEPETPKPTTVETGSSSKSVMVTDPSSSATVNPKEAKNPKEPETPKPTLVETGSSSKSVMVPDPSSSASMNPKEAKTPKEPETPKPTLAETGSSSWSVMVPSDPFYSASTNDQPSPWCYDYEWSQPNGYAGHNQGWSQVDGRYERPIYDSYASYESGPPPSQNGDNKSCHLM